MSRPPLPHRLAHWFGGCLNRLGDFWHWLVGPVERLLGRLGESAFGALDSFESLETFVVGVVRAAFWPVAALGRLVGRLIPSMGERGPFVWIQIGVVRFFGSLFQLAERLNLDGVLIFLSRLLIPLWWPVASLFGFVRAWLATRQPRELALAAPAVIFAAPFVYVAVEGAMLGQADIAERYKVAVREAAEQADYERVSLYERKLAQLGVDTRRRDYQTALVVADGGDMIGALQRMTRLAPEESPGYPSAHMWIVQNLLSGELTAEHDPRFEPGSPAALEFAEKHLSHLETLEVGGAVLSMFRAHIYAQTGRLQEAADELQPLAGSVRPAAMTRLRLLTQLSDLQAGKDQARVVLDIMADPSHRDSASPEDLQGWALAAELLGNADQMEAALAAWYAVEPDNSRPKELLSKFRREQAEELLSNPTSSPARSAEVLADAVRLGSPKVWTNKVAATLAKLRADSHYAQSVWERTANLPNAPEALLEALGTAAAATGDIEGARELLRGLVEANSERAIVWNNYAWALLQEPSPDPQTALEAVNHALELRPRDYRFLETRGQVLIALGRWQEAIKDLEYALNGLPESAEVHLSLATAYEALAKPSLAEMHRRQAAR